MSTVDPEVFVELTAAKARYCRLLDTKDWAGLSQLLAEDVELDLSQREPPDHPIVGRDEVLGTLASLVAGAVTVHQVHAPEIEADGGVARAVWAVHERVTWDDGTKLTAYGHYHDVWVRVGDSWRLSASRLRHLSMEVE